MTAPLVILAYPKVDHEKNYVYFWMPFSLLAIARSLQDVGSCEVVIFDGNQSSQEHWERLLDAELPRAICIGVSVMTGGGQIRHALELVEAAKRRPGCPPVVFGGPHVNVLGLQSVAHPLVDAVLVGPGQASMPPLVQALLGNIPFASVPGLIMKQPGSLITGPLNPPKTQQLGKYPWELLDVERYIRDDPTIASRTLNYVSSQGCIYKCRFCYELTYQRKYSSLPATDLLHDVIGLVTRFGINGVKFYDADWFVDRARSLGFAKGLIDMGLNLRWAASINPNDILKARGTGQPLLELAARSGCSRLLMGVESGSDRVLEQIVQKEVTREKILSVAAQIASLGILGSYTFIIGFPGESEDEMKETLSLIEELWTLSPVPETRVHIFAPYPGTPLFETALKHGFSPPQSLEDWSAYDYYRAQTPWVKPEINEIARQYTRMVLRPEPVAV